MTTLLFKINLSNPLFQKGLSKPAWVRSTTLDALHTQTNFKPEK